MKPLAGLCALLLTLAPPWAAAQEKVQFASLDKWKGEVPLVIDGYLYKPAGKEKFAAIAMFHGCIRAAPKRSRRRRSSRPMGRC